MLLNGKNRFVEPAIQRKIAADAAQKRHGRMGMHIAKPRHGKRAFAIDGFIRLKDRRVFSPAGINNQAVINQNFGIIHKRNMRLIDNARCHQNVGDSCTHLVLPPYQDYKLL